ncbi:AsnC family protein [Specibacter sp. NPDC057265]|uniref:AsnC family protein n=1 Tax=Specibacter sp. NPDC057265 TaxID=3346075 RepID=UPI003632DE99
MKTLLDGAGGVGPAEALYALAEQRRELARMESELVARARSAGLSWEAIALCLGVSKQAVHKKFGKR